MQLGRMWVVVALVLLVATAELSAAKRGKGRGKKARKFGNRGITKNFKTEASRAYYNHNGVSNGVCWCHSTSWFFRVQFAPRCWVALTTYYLDLSTVNILANRS